MDNKILLDKDFFDKILLELKEIKFINKDQKVDRRIESLLKLLESELNKKKLTVEEMIKEKMKESKISDPDLNANLYLLYRNLINGKITEEDALRRFETYIKMAGYDKKIY